MLKLLLITTILAARTAAGQFQNCQRDIINGRCVTDLNCDSSFEWIVDGWCGGVNEVCCTPNWSPGGRSLLRPQAPTPSSGPGSGSGSSPVMTPSPVVTICIGTPGVDACPAGCNPVMDPATCSYLATIFEGGKYNYDASWETKFCSKQSACKPPAQGVRTCLFSGGAKVPIVRFYDGHYRSAQWLCSSLPTKTPAPTSPVPTATPTTPSPNAKLVDPCRQHDKNKKNCVAETAALCDYVKLKPGNCVGAVCAGAKKLNVCVGKDCNVYTPKGQRKCKKSTGCKWNSGVCVTGLVNCASITKKSICGKHPGCTWDKNTKACLGGPLPAPSSPCSAMAGRGACLKLPLGCTWDKKSGTCLGANAPAPATPAPVSTPCLSMTTNKDCGRNPLGCTWNKSSNRCNGSITPAPVSTPCSAMAGRALCQKNPLGCTWNTKSNTCNGSITPAPVSTPCSTEVSKTRCGKNPLGCTWDRKLGVCA